MGRELKYFYLISEEPDEELLKKLCAALERKFTNMRADDLLEDVDGSSQQHYHHEKGEIRVCNDYYLGDLYVESEFELVPYL